MNELIILVKYLFMEGIRTIVFSSEMVEKTDLIVFFNF